MLGQYIDQVNQATANFAANVTDPKAQIITTYDYQQGVVRTCSHSFHYCTLLTSNDVQLLAAIMLFYDAPEQPADIFDEFMALPALATNISTRSFFSLVQVEPTTTSANIRYEMLGCSRVVLLRCTSGDIRIQIGRAHV